MRFPLRAVLALAGTLLATACGGGGGDPTNPNPNPNPNPTPGTLAVALSSTSGSVVAGNQTTVTATITRGGSFTGVVTLSAEGAPAGVTASFTASSLATGVTTSTLSLQVGGSVAAGTYPITVRASGTGVTAATASYALTVTAAATPTLTLAGSASTVSVAQGQASSAVTYTLTRGGGLTGNATMALENAPAGVTGTFTPNPATGTTSQLVVNVGGSVAAGTYPLTVRATVGTVSATTALSLTVTATATGDVTLTLAPTSTTVTAGGSTNVTVSLARTGGFTGTVNLTATGAPAGVTTSFAPAAATGATSTLTISVAASVAAGTYPIVIRGNAAGLPERTTTFTLTVQSGGGGGGGNVTWQFCEATRFPLWFAYRDGTSGAWTRVLPGANQTYSFTINADRGGVAYVLDDGGTEFDVQMFLYTRAELTALGTSECQNNPGKKTLTGTVAGLAAGQSATITIGTGTGTAAVNGPVTVTNVNDGITDLFAARTTFDIPTLSTVPSAFVLRRNVNLPNNGSLGTIDFNGAEAFAPATANYTIGNVGADNLTVTMGFSTANGASGFFAFGPLTGGSATRPVFGVPLARTQAGDLHYVLASAVSGTTIVRQVAGYNRELTDRTLTLGPVLAAPTVSSVATAPYRRLRATGSIPAEYNQAVGIFYSQTGGTGRGWGISMSAGYAGGAAYDLEIPDFSGVAGFNTAWGLANGLPTDWALSASRVDNSGNGAPVENFRFFSGSRTGTLP